MKNISIILGIIISLSVIAGVLLAARKSWADKAK
jgi:hypothetical protein